MPKTNDLVVKTLIEAGVKKAFTLPGLGITWMLPAFFDRQGEIDVVLTRNEWIASIMAQVTGRLTGSPAVVMGQGPWMTTMGAVGILEAYFSGSPLVVLTETSDYNGQGQHGVYQTMTGDYGAADAMASLKPITKYCTYATTPEEAVFGTQMAVKHSTLPRKGPAAVIMKTAIIRKEVEGPFNPMLYDTKGYLSYTPARPDEDAVKKLAQLIDGAENPVIIAGNGVLAANAGVALQNLAEGGGIAVATSYNGKGVIAETSHIAVGMLGTWGSPTANRAVARADLVIMLGASMGSDYTRFRDPEMIRPGEQTLVQIDIDPRNAGWVYPVDLAITGDARDVIDKLAEMGLSAAACPARLEAIRKLKDDTGYTQLPDMAAAEGSMHQSDLIRSLQSFLGAEDMLTLDAGSNRLWATFGLRMPHPQQLVVPGGTGIMGWGIPAAAAAKMVHPEKRLTSLSGDGGFMMTMQTITTCVQQNLDVVYLVSNNSGLGMVRDNLGPKRIAVDFADIDFVSIAEGMGGKGLRVSHKSEVGDALEEAHRMGGPVVIDAKVDVAASHHPAVDNEPLR